MEPGPVKAVTESRLMDRTSFFDLCFYPAPFSRSKRTHENRDACQYTIRFNRTKATDNSAISV